MAYVTFGYLVSTNCFQLRMILPTREYIESSGDILILTAVLVVLGNICYYYIVGKYKGFCQISAKNE